ncbi:MULTISPECIES: acetate--CoA ligase family protein [Sphingobium]|uniref:acetate--CoA ligase family protein n=1 Tax=Sphingobium TaxID=165695 RepID=UPI00159C906F|nr:acetate--CoA ligase family protein [Sphingobium sp. 15-1]
MTNLYDVTVDPATDRRPGMEALLRPRSIAIFGMSSRPGTTGRIILKQILGGGFSGDIHLVGRSGGEVEGIPILTVPEELPEGIDLAILTVPAEGLHDAIQACVARKIGSAVSFASGFAELGEEGRRRQEEIAAVAARGNLALLGPNTVGYYNFVDGLTVMMIDQASPPPLPKDSGPAMAIVAQSGGIANHLAGSLRARSVPLSYIMTTGNEAVIDVSQLVDHFLDDDRTQVIAAYAEQIGAPQDFLALGAKAKARGKSVLLLHPGRTAKGQAAASTHTGSLAGNYAAMALAVEQAGILLVETMEELIDVAQLLLYFPQAPEGGLGLLTTSGALCALSADYLDSRELDMPALSDGTLDALRAMLPDYLSPKNPLDLGTLPAWKPEMIGAGAAQLLADPNIGSIIVSLPLTEADRMTAWLTSFSEAYRAAPKPTIFVLAGEDCPLPDALLQSAARDGIVLMRSNERAIRALATYHRHAGDRRRPAQAVQPEKFAFLPPLGSGTQAEWSSKAVVSAIGIPVPPGALAVTPDEAVSIAERVGYPVVMKAQAASLAHKSEVGGVMLSLRDADAVRSAWDRLHANVAKGRPDLRLDVILVEAMGRQGLELVVGATRDAAWGPIMMVGLGGIWVEALQDVRLISPAMSRNRIVEELGRLKAARLLHGFRGAPPVDVEAVADAVQAVARLMTTEPAIKEIDINPLVALPVGEGVIALDALIVVE